MKVSSSFQKDELHTAAAPIPAQLIGLFISLDFSAKSKLSKLLLGAPTASCTLDRNQTDQNQVLQGIPCKLALSLAFIRGLN